MRCWTAMCLLRISCVLLTSQAFAQDIGTDEIRQQAKQILSEAEFRYFDHLDDSSDRPPSRSALKRRSFSTSGGEDGEGTSGSGSGGMPSSGEGRGSKSRPSRKTHESTSSDANEDSGSDLGSLPIGGIGAIGNFFGIVFHALAYLVLIAVCVLIIYLIVLAVMNRERGPASISGPQFQLDVPAEEDHSPGELPADVYLAKARELAERRQYREAIAYLLLGGMSAIERAELIRHRRGLTLRDYLRVLRGRDPQFAGFQSLIGLYEPVGFGRRIASYQTFQDALSGYEQAVHQLA